MTEQTELFPGTQAPADRAWEEKQEARRARYARRALQAREEAERRQRDVDAMLGVMNGQPILIGHHSEKRHRRDIARIDANIHKAIELTRKAEHYEARAKGAGRNGISSDDPSAQDKLGSKVAALKRERSHKKVVNSAWRRHGKPGPDAPQEIWAKIAENAHMTPAELAEVRRTMTVCRWHGCPYPGYVFSNLGSRIRQAQQRAETIEASAQIPDSRTKTPSGIALEVDTEDNRIRIRTPEKPPQAQRDVLKRWGFRWSPRNVAWQRMITPNAQAAAEHAVKELERMRSITE